MSSNYMNLILINGGITDNTMNEKFQYATETVKHIANGDTGKISDGYHTFDELYDHRAVLFAALCAAHSDIAWKSKQHDDPDFPMYDGMFICGIDTPAGQATYHYNIDPYWDMFKVKELERAPKYDGHTPQDVIERLKSLI